MAIVAFLVAILILLLLPLKISFRELYDKVLIYYRVMCVHFETIDGLVDQSYLKFHFILVKVALINDPELISKALCSHSCMEKPFMIYNFFEIDNGMISASCKFL